MPMTAEDTEETIEQVANEALTRVTEEIEAYVSERALKSIAIAIAFVVGIVFGKLVL